MAHLFVVGGGFLAHGLTLTVGSIAHTTNYRLMRSFVYVRASIESSRHSTRLGPWTGWIRNPLSTWAVGLMMSDDIYMRGQQAHQCSHRS